MSESQHLEDIFIPDIEIAAGWSVDEIETVEDCNDAYAYLQSAVAEIEYELELKALGVCRFSDPTWPARARRSLKYKRTALQLITHKRGRIERARREELQSARDRALLEFIKSHVEPSQFRQWIFESGVDRSGSVQSEDFEQNAA